MFSMGCVTSSNNHNDIGLSMSDRSENTKYSFKRMRHMTQNLRMSPLPYSGCEAGFLARSEKLPSTDGPSGVCVCFSWTSGSIHFEKQSLRYLIKSAFSKVSLCCAARPPEEQRSSI
ncbi:hypothetical protein F442_12765 [Phytophthora nicotianae P10297]|uniref:Uncharacterized protein n=1 Tax=Phytophthora nicotianae P10297 TaxID=1317064 RepID=W2YXE5_PHYNI|nr:hypothetical protein F442_12765 [Phytophthora nicotianae P10297]